MALHGANQQAQAQEQNTAAPTAARRGGFMGGGLFGAPISKGLGSEYLNKIAEGLTEKYKTAHPDMKLSVHIVDQVNEPALAYSVIVVTGQMKAAPGTIAAHVLIIEGTNDRLTPLFENVGGQSVEITRVTSDAFDRRMEAIIRERLNKAYPNAQINIIDGCVVPMEFEPTNLTHMHNLALNAGLACGTDLQMRVDDFRDINIANEVKGTMLVDIQPTHGQIEDTIGMPVRSDVAINFRSQRPNQGQDQSVNSNDRDIQIASLSGFVDMMYAPMAANQGNYWSPQQQAPQKFAARLVLTNLRTEIGYTPGMVLLALVNAMTLNNNGNWIQVFRPTPGRSKEVDMRDIGALNIIGNMEGNQNGFGVPPETKTQDFSLQDLGRFVATLVRPGLTISLDVPDCSSTTWYLSIFRDASMGKTGAIDAIYHAACELTNGQFQNHFSRGTPMFEDVNNRVHLGYWTDKNGQRRDIRDIDFLAIANLHGRKNPLDLMAWSNTFLNYNIPLQMRLAQRRKMIEAATSMSAVFNGMGTRVTPSAAFLRALALSCSEAGLSPVVKTPLSASDFNSQNGVADFVQSTAVDPSQAFGHVGFGFGPNQFVNRGNGFTRW